MELRQLRTFAAVARTMSFTRAAQELHFAQSSVSEQIQALERDLGAELFDRSRRSLRLTSAGAALQGYAERIIGLADEARAAVAGVPGALAVGALETLSTHRLPGVLARFREVRPDARVVVSQGNRGELYERVGRGELDLCLTFGSAPENLAHSEVIAVEPLVIVVPRDHRLAGRESVALNELADEPFLSTAPGCGFREMYDSTFGALPSLVAELDSIGTLGACVAAGMGCALLPETAVRGLDVSTLSLPDKDFSTTVTMTWNDNANPELKPFQDLLRTR
ncbi:LysR family transcriptional regulator [Actinokineospora enzanensis]|uniref:LysR family transcriptional regulator n=1 Tax=Actinokineospora enzanensis TaxID=155975 RepID=UPI00039A1C12|nr:LysR family transcriptional regulator [Actinokineospora enzanensis]